MHSLFRLGDTCDQRLCEFAFGMECGGRGACERQEATCACQDGWTGDACEHQTQPLTNGTILFSPGGIYDIEIKPKEWFFLEAHTGTHEWVHCSLTTAELSSIQLFARRDGYPTLQSYDVFDEVCIQLSIELYLISLSSERLVARQYSSCSFNLSRFNRL